MPNSISQVLMNQLQVKLLFLLIALGGISSCTRKKASVVWQNDLPVIGSQSSPRAVDLNGDGVLDIVMGAGSNESQESSQGIVAFDGQTGNILWEQAAADQVYGSATFYDVTGDGISDVFIGGRGPHFKALNGKDGTVIWEYAYTFENDPILTNAKFNFNNSILIPDQNNNGSMDLITSNGGNGLAVPNSEKDRFPGVLMILDSKTGNVLAADTMPDGKESYMSPLCFAQPGSDDYLIIFGTGGETIDGNLYMGHLSDLKNKNLSNCRIIASEKKHGFIAPPSVADINQDGYYDIVAISHASSVFAIDGKSEKLIWTQKVPNTESSNSFAVGYFNEDKVPDFFTFVSKGEWPNNVGSFQIMLNGIDGSIGFKDSIGCTGFSSPVVYDLNSDGVDEAIISINEFDCNKGFVTEAIEEIENKVVAINFRDRTLQAIDQARGFKNIFSTPWLGDLDADGYLDLVYCQYFSRGGLLVFLGMRAKRVETPIKINKVPTVGCLHGNTRHWYIHSD